MQWLEDGQQQGAVNARAASVLPATASPTYRLADPLTHRLTDLPTHRQGSFALAMTQQLQQSARPVEYRRFERPTPAWYADAKLGIFIHWGAYSVPAWAEPIGPLGAFDPGWWSAHNPYAEWYYNTIRIDGSPAQRYQLETYGSLDYEQFLDLWRAEQFDAGRLMDLVKAAGARYVVPTTKHHDGIALWDAPGSGEWNTVCRGPRRNLVRELRDAAVSRGIRFGAYYSGGLDWHFSQLPPITAEIGDDVRPRDAAYAAYAHRQVIDLIDRYRPAVLWGDIDWPDAGKEPGPHSLIGLLEHYYEVVPDGVVNDRFGDTHWDFRTSEYLHNLDAESSPAWENTRGIGFSYGYNQLEDARHYLTGGELIRHFVDVVSRGGNLLLNVGPTAAGAIPDDQERALRELGAFCARHEAAIFGSRPLPTGIAQPSDQPWLRWTAVDGWAHGFLSTEVEVVLPVEAADVEVGSLTAVDAEARVRNGEVLVRATTPLPGRISLRLR